jgi:hypothetical protein
MNMGAILIAAAVTLGPSPHSGSTITYAGTDITCKQMEAFFRKMAKASHGKIKPMPCRENATVAPKKSN